MRGRVGSRGRAIGFVTVLASLLAWSSAGAREGLGGYVDVGLGGGKAEPYVVGSAVSSTVGFGAFARLRGPAVASLQFRASVGGDIPAGRIPESATAGRQSLTTVLAGIELVPWRSMRGPFVMAGVGFGHSTLSSARGPTEPPNGGFIPLEDHTGLAFGFGAGLRSSGGPGPLGLQLAISTHGVLRDRAIPAMYFTNVTLGLCY